MRAVAATAPGVQAACPPHPSRNLSLRGRDPHVLTEREGPRLSTGASLISVPLTDLSQMVSGDHAPRALSDASADAAALIPLAPPSGM